jgi:hypothetical protein
VNGRRSFVRMSVSTLLIHHTSISRAPGTSLVKKELRVKKRDGHHRSPSFLPCSIVSS